MSEHAILAPSSMAVTVGCPASVKAQERYPEDEETTAAREGTASHEAAQIALTLGEWVKVGDRASNDVIYTEEIIEAAKMLVEDVAETVLERGHQLRTGYFHIEKRVNMPGIHKDNWGTPDVVVYFPDDKDLFIWDYKYGHLLVEAEHNWQCLNYAEGHLNTLQIMGVDISDVNIWINIIQPRGYHEDGPIRRWWIRYDEFGPYRKKMIDACVAAMGPNPRMETGLHCRYCRARHACKALQQAAYTAIDYAQQSQLQELDGDALGTELKILQRAEKLLSYRIDGLKEAAKDTIKRGSNVSGYRVEAAKGNLKWDKSTDEVVALGKALGVNLEKPQVLTPRQAIDSGLDEATVKQLSSRPDRGFKLTYDDGRKAASVFKQKD